MPKLLHDLQVPHQFDVPLAPLTWYNVGGPAKILARPNNPAQLASLINTCRNDHVPIYALGSGANLLVADAGVDAVVVKLDAPAFKELNINTQTGTVTVGAGYDLARLVLETAKAGLSGLQCLAGIPATLGGAVRMNAGGAFGDVGRSVKRIQVVTHTGHIDALQREDLAFSYRKTNITDPFIIQVELELTPADPDELVKEIKKIFTFKSASQPLRDHSAGCAFKNPPPQADASAGKLIDLAGLKGFTINAAAVSDIHANFIVTRPGCTAADILAVIEHVKQTVLHKTGVLLEQEIVAWP